MIEHRCYPGAFGGLVSLTAKPRRYLSMKKIIQIFGFAIILFIAACASQEVNKEQQLAEEFNQDILYENYGIRFTAPINTKLIDVSENDKENELRIAFIGTEIDGLFFISLYKNYCNLNDIDSRYTWGHLKGCLATHMRSIKSGNKNIIESSHHVYAAQAIYFNSGSFITPTTVFDTKFTYKIDAQKFRFKSLGYAYKFNDSYYLIEIAYNTSEVDYDFNTNLFSKFIKSIDYP